MAELSSTDVAFARRRQLAAWYLTTDHVILWYLTLSAGLFLCLLLVLYRGPRVDAKANLEESRAALAAFTPAPVPAAENAADDYWQAEAAYARYSGPYAAEPSISYRRPSGMRVEEPAVAAYLRQNQKVIQILLQAAAKKRCNWGLDYRGGLALQMPHLSSCRRSAHLLAAHARALAQAGDHAGAARSLSAIYAICRHLESDPLLISSAVSITAAALADNCLEAILCWDTPSSAQEVAGYRAAVRRNRWDCGAFARVIEADKWTILREMDSAAVHGTALDARVGHIAYWLHSWVGGTTLAHERQCFAGASDELARRCLKGQWLTEEQMEEEITKHQASTAVWARHRLPLVAVMQNLAMCSEEKSRVMEAALAWLEYRLKHGREPAGLDDLVPAFLSSIPRGVFYGHSILFRVVEEDEVQWFDLADEGLQKRLPGAVRLYGLGPDARDTQGRHGQFDASFLLPPFVSTAILPEHEAREHQP